MLAFARSDADKHAAREFLRTHGVELPFSSDFMALGRFSAGKLIAVVGYNGFNGAICSMHNAGDGNWISREYLREAFRYPFETCARSHIVVTVAANNHRALKLNKHLGFEVMHRFRDGWEPGVDTVIMAMTKQACRWIRQEKQDERKAA
jgi:RimJ/RimL family protein N-acetyltransferase